MNLESLKLGDKLVVTRDGRTSIMTVWHISPPMSGGRRESAGPMIHAQIRPGGWGVTIDYSTFSIQARRLTDDDCEEFIVDGSCIHSDHTP
jgi:hypothetical protein